MSLFESRDDGRMSTAPLLCGAVALALLVFSPAHAALWYESYAKAERAVESGEWDEVIRQVNMALEQKGDSDARARTYGMNFVEYFPYYTIGVAYHNLGQHEAALQAFETEERLGKIQQATAKHESLQQIRGQIEQARATAAEDQQRRIQQIVTDNLAAAAELEQQGKLQEAIATVDQALTARVDDPEAIALKQRLLDKLARVQQEQDNAERVAGLLRQGRDALSSQEFEQASSLFNQVLEIGPNAEARTLLDRAQSRLREQIQSQVAAENLQREIDTGLEEARALETAGRVEDALRRLQSVLALDPDHPGAQAVEQRLLGQQATLEANRQRDEKLNELLREAEVALGANRYNEVLTAANRALALDQQSEAARNYTRLAFRGLNQSFLSGADRPNFPPSIRFPFAAFRTGNLTQDGAVVTGSTDDDELQKRTILDLEVVRSPSYRLAATVEDETQMQVDCQLLYFGKVSGKSTNGIEQAVESLLGNSPTLFGVVPEMEFVELAPSVQQQDDRHVYDYAVDRRLRPGLTVFRLVATDPAGATSRNDYAVVYERPWFRHPWLYYGVSLGVLAAVAAGYAQRVRRRNQLLKRRFNPYIAGAPVLKDGIFFGRERLMSRVLQTIHNNSILLYGERRIGKTSFQHRLKKRLQALDDPDYTFYPVYIDLQGTPQEKFFATLADDLFHELEPLLDGRRPDPVLGDGDRYQYREFVRDLRGVLKVLETKTDKKVKVVLLIDEVDELNAYDPRVNQRLRSLFMKNFAEQLAAVVSGVAIKRQWESEGSPWYNFFEEIEVTPFRDQDAEELICNPIRGVFQVEQGVVDAVIRLTGCKPYLIQKLCVQLVNRLHEQGRRRMTVADVEAIGPPAEE